MIRVLASFWVLLLLATSGCEVTTKPSRYVRHFVPPAPVPRPPDYQVEAAPPLHDPIVAREIPNLFSTVALTPARSLETEMRIGRAEAHFQEGVTAVRKGNWDAARSSFDAALEFLSAGTSNPVDRDRLKARFATMAEEIHRLEIEAGQTANPEGEPVFDRSPIDDISQMTFPVEPGLKGKVREQLLSTVSQLPLELADPVVSFINYFSSPRGNRTITAGLRRAGRYAPMIRRILDEEGLPPELIFMAQAESGFLPRAVSVKKATGMWQFVKFRGLEYGLQQTTHADDRLDPEKATRAAARHLRDLYGQFGDWYLAIAAYNCGPGNVERAVLRTGYADFWQLYSRNVLPRETANYLPIILAMTIMSKNPKDYGLDGVVPDAPLEYDTIPMTSSTHLALIADIVAKPLHVIQEMNPSVLKLTAPSGHGVHVPKGVAKTVLAALDAIPPEKRMAWRVHRVGSTDTVASIARQYKIAEKSMQAANGSRLASIEAGDFIFIPVSYPGAVAEKKPGVRTKKPVSGRARTTTARKPAAARSAVTRAAVNPASPLQARAR